ncbi:MAG: AI-2E family transporter [Sporocytophaga sp.]|nr:AI-2E family transporter [Sporocytophaga sp.]
MAILKFRYINRLLFSTFLIIGGLYLARPFLIPVTIASLLAMLLLPVARKLDSLGIKRAISIILCITLFLLILIGLTTLLSMQGFSLAKNLEEIEQQFRQIFDNIQEYIQSKFGMEKAKQSKIIREKTETLLQSSTNLITGFIGGLATFGLIMVYTFFFLYYRNKFFNFILMISPKDLHQQNTIILNQISKVTQRYLTGVFIVILILAVMNSSVLLLLGVNNAIFFGCLAAVLNVIPYIGVIIGSLLPFIMTLVTKNAMGPALVVLGTLWFNQVIENNLLTPFITGSQVRVNPLSTIMALILGGLIWGVFGMILFIPLIGIIKIIFDHVEELKPFGYLIGDDSDEGENNIRKIKRLFKKN